MKDNENSEPVTEVDGYDAYDPDEDDFTDGVVEEEDAEEAVAEDEQEPKAPVIPDYLAIFLMRFGVVVLALVVYFFFLSKVPLDDGLLAPVVLGFVITALMAKFLHFIKVQLVLPEGKVVLERLKEMREVARNTPAK